jgi:hypothetical protein
MSRPPMLMHVKVYKKDETDFGLWLPLFLLFPLALVILIILSPLIFVAVLILWPSGWIGWAFRVLRAAIESFWAMRGLEVEVKDINQHVQISVV